MQYDNENRGSLFKNDKGDNPKRPAYQGKINISGTEYKLSAWVQTPKNGGAKYMSLQVKGMESVAVATHSPHSPTDDSDEIPF